MELEFSHIHFMWGRSLFNTELIKFINQEMDSSGHLFVIFNVSNLNELVQDQNVVCERDEGLKTLYKYSAIGENIILHSLPYSAWEVMCMKKHVSEKIIWCVWGHDLYRCYSPIILSKCFCKRVYQRLKQWLRPMHSKIMDILWRFADKKITNFKSIVLCFKGDRNEAIKRFGNKIKIFYSAYTAGYFTHDIDSIEDEDNRKEEIKILIGHSSFEFLQHTKYLDRLQMYKNENIKIILPLSYGNTPYGDEIEAYAKQLFGDKLCVIRETMDWMSYTALIKQVDIGIFDYEHQSALGNITLLLYFGKKVYLSPTGILMKGYKEENIETYDCHEVGNIPFDMFCRHIYSQEKGIQYARGLFDKQELMKKWNSIFEYTK